MPRNIETKLRCPDLVRVRRLALAARAEDRGLLVQTDTFYDSLTGRLKLREIAGERAELIWYVRDDVAGVKGSDYVVAPVADPALMHAVLSRCCGARQVVRKRRELLLWRNVRIHLDTVDLLGTFVELESVVGDVDEAAARANLDELLARLALREAEPVAVAYVDLL